MIKNKKILLIMGLIFILMILPLSFAADNESAGDVLNEGGDVGDFDPSIFDPSMFEPKDVYYDSSADDNGDGSENNPYKEFNNETFTMFSAPDGSTVHLANGEYDFNGIAIFNNMNIIGESTQNTIVKNAVFGSYSTLYDVSSADSSLIIQNVTFINSSFLQFNDFTATDCVFNGFSDYGMIISATDENAYYFYGKYANITLNECIFSNCFSEYGGIINIQSGILEIHNSFIESSGSNVINALGATVLLRDTDVWGSKLESTDSVIQLNDGVLYLFNSRFMDNIVTSSSIVNVISSYEGGQLISFNSTFVNNTVDFGVIISDNAFLNITNSSFEKNHANRFAGAISATQSTLLLENTTFTQNTATWSGGAVMALNTTLQITSCEFYNNSALCSGGAVYAMHGGVLIGGSVFVGNTGLNGGAIFFDDVDSIYPGYPLSYYNYYQDNEQYSIYAITDTEYDFSMEPYVNPDDIFQTKYPNLIIGNGDYSLIKFTPSFNGTIPVYYDLRQKGWVTPIKNQGPDGNCWAFTGVATLESCILKAIGETYDFSEVNMKNLMAIFSDYGWNVLTNQGGTPEMAIAYLTSWLGPVYENDDPYSPSNYFSEVLHSYFHVQNVLYLDYNDFNSIKQAVIEYGAVGIGMAWNETFANNASYYCWDESVTPNHAVTIIGWNDTYSRYNFNSTHIPEGDGAWIIKNSWGEDEGDEGYFYVSYYDKVFGTYGTIYTFILNDTVRFDKNYQYDIQGHITLMNYDQSYVWYKNMFNATEDEYLAAVSTYFLKDNTDYTISININGQSILNQSGVSKRGYYTINLDKIIPLNKGDAFEVVFKITVDEGKASVPVGHISYYKKLLSQPEVSFISPDGSYWEDLYDESVACIKAFTIVDEIKTTLKLTVDESNITAIVTDQYGNVLNKGNVVFKINDKIETVPIMDNKAILQYDFSYYDSYNITAEWSSPAYSDCINNTSFETEWDVKLNIKNINYSEQLIVNVTLAEGKTLNKNITIKIGDNTYSVNITENNGLFTVPDTLNANPYDASIIYTYYNGNQKNTSTSFTIFKINSTLEDMESFSFDYGDTGSVNVEYSNANNVTAFVHNHSEAKVIVKDNTIIISNLDAGDYTLNVTTVTDSNHNNVSKTVDFKVNKKQTELVILNNATWVGISSVVYAENHCNPLIGVYTIDVITNDANNDTPTATLMYQRLTDFIVKFNGSSDNVILNTDATFYLKNLTVGIYDLYVELNDTNRKGNKTFNIQITKGWTDLSIPKLTIVYGESGNVTANTTASGVMLYIIGADDVISVDGKVITVSPGLDVGNYTFIFTVDDTNWKSESAEFNVSVIKADSTLDDVNASDFKYGDEGKVSVKVNSTGAIGINAFVVGHSEAIVNIINDEITISNLTTGNYTLNVTTIGDKNHNNAFKLFDFKAKGYSQPEINIPTIESYKSSSIPVFVGKDATGTVSLIIDGKPIHDYDLINGSAVLEVPKLSSGPHNISISYSGDENHSSFNVNNMVDVVSLAKITGDDLTVFYLDGSVYTVRVFGDDGNPLSGAQVVFKINGKVIANAVTDKDGYAYYKITLAPKTYTIVCEAIGLNITKQLTVKNVIKAKKTVKVKKSRRVTKIKITLKGKQAYKNKKLTVKFNGKKYKVKTNGKGVAKFKVTKKMVKKFKKGKKVKYTISYNDAKLKRYIKIK